jgi:hypothetical protein
LLPEEITLAEAATNLVLVVFVETNFFKTFFIEAAPERPAEFNEEEEFQLIVENAEKSRRKPGLFGNLFSQSFMDAC